MDAATLGFGVTFSSLATREGLVALDIFRPLRRKRTFYRTTSLC